MASLHHPCLETVQRWESGHTATGREATGQSTCRDGTRRSPWESVDGRNTVGFGRADSDHYALYRNYILLLPNMSPNLRKSFMKNWFAVEATPIFAVMGVAVLGAGWYLTRLARGPTVIWTRDNPTPWNDIQPNEGTKLLTVNQHFEKSWERKKL